MKILLKTLAVMTIFATTACSLSKTDGSSIQVRLVPEDPAVEIKKLSLMNFLSIQTPQSIDDLGCFAINVKGPSIPSQLECQGKIQRGIMDGPLPGLQAIFEPLVPVSDDVVFEAYGGPGTCQGGPATTFNDADFIFKLGTRVENLASNQKKEVFIPVAFDVTQGFGCRGTPVVLFEDPMTYGVGNLSLTPNWVTSGCTNNIPVNATVIDINGTPPDACNAWIGQLDTSAVFYRVGLKVIGGPGPGAVPPFIAMGIANNTNVGSANGFGCKFTYPNVADPNTVIILAGPTTSSFTPTGTGTANLTITGANARFTCEIQFEPNGMVKIRAQIFNSTGGLDHTHIETGISASGAPGSNRVFLNFDRNAVGNWAAGMTADDFKIEQGFSRQF